MTTAKINKQQWDSLSDEERRAVAEALVDGDIIAGADEIEPSPDVDSLGEAQAHDFVSSLEEEDDDIKPMIVRKMKRDLCRATCKAAAVIGGAACAKLSGPAFAACTAVVADAYRKCYERC